MNNVSSPVSAKGVSGTVGVTAAANDESNVYNSSAYINAFIAAKRGDVKAFDKFKRQAQQNIITSENEINPHKKTSKKIDAALKAGSLLPVASELNGGSNDTLVELEVKLVMLFGSKELEWMYKERTCDEVTLVRQGVELLRDDRTTKGLALLSELLAKDSPIEALGLLNGYLNTLNSANAFDRRADRTEDFTARILLDKAFILLKSKGDREGAMKIYKEVQLNLNSIKYDGYIIEMLNVLGNYLLK